MFLLVYGSPPHTNKGEQPTASSQSKSSLHDPPRGLGMPHTSMMQLKGDAHWEFAEQSAPVPPHLASLAEQSSPARQSAAWSTGSHGPPTPEGGTHWLLIHLNELIHWRFWKHCPPWICLHRLSWHTVDAGHKWIASQSVVGKSMGLMVQVQYWGWRQKSGGGQVMAVLMVAAVTSGIGGGFGRGWKVPLRLVLLNNSLRNEKETRKWFRASKESKDTKQRDGTTRSTRHARRVQITYNTSSAGILHPLVKSNITRSFTDRSNLLLATLLFTWLLVISL